MKWSLALPSSAHHGHILNGFVCNVQLFDGARYLPIPDTANVGYSACKFWAQLVEKLDAKLFRTLRLFANPLQAVTASGAVAAATDRATTENLCLCQPSKAIDCAHRHDCDMTLACFDNEGTGTHIQCKLFLTRNVAFA